MGQGVKFPTWIKVAGSIPMVWLVIGLVFGAVLRECTSTAQAWSDNDTGRAINNIDASLVRIANAMEKCK